MYLIKFFGTVGRPLYFHIIFQPPLCRFIHGFPVCKIKLSSTKIFKHKKKNPMFNHTLNKPKRKKERLGSRTHKGKKNTEGEEKPQDFGVIRRKRIIDGPKPQVHCYSQKHCHCQTHQDFLSLSSPHGSHHSLSLKHTQCVREREGSLSLCTSANKTIKATHTLTTTPYFGFRSSVASIRLLLYQCFVKPKFVSIYLFRLNKLSCSYVW